jgi:Tfp pilus assembly major pilin PilA
MRLSIRTREKLAKAAGGKAVRTVQNSIERLEKLGLLIVHHSRGRGSANVYEFPAQKLYETWAASRRTGSEKGASDAPVTEHEKVQTTTQKGANDDKKKVQQTYPSLFKSSPYSSQPKSSTSEPRAAAAVAQSGLSDGRRDCGFWCEPNSPEFDAWSEHYTDEGMTRAKQGMLTAAHSGRSVRVPTQWPPERKRTRP